MNRTTPVFVLVSTFIVCTVFVGSVYSSMGVHGPYIAYPKSSTGAPWDAIGFGIDVTNAEQEIANVTLFYSVNKTDPQTYVEVPMNLTKGDNRTGSWTCEIPPQENGTTIWYYASVLDVRGNDHSPISEFDQPREFRIQVFYPRLQVIFFRVKDINEKELTANIEVTFHIYRPEDKNLTRVYYNNKNVDVGDFEVEIAQRFEFTEQKELKLNLIGSAEEFPFDNYYMDIIFSTLYETDVEFTPKQIYFGDYFDYYIWDYSYDNATEKFQQQSVINVHVYFKRKIERTYFFIIPTLVCFFLLGASHLLESTKRLTGRLTIYLTIFVFVASFSASEVLRDMIPLSAIGVNVAELTLNLLGAYSGIYSICTLIGNFASSISRRTRIDPALLADLAAIISALLIFFSFPVFRIDVPFRKEVKSLYTQIPDLLFKGLILCGLIYGWIISFLKHIYERLRSTTPTLEYVQ